MCVCMCCVVVGSGVEWCGVPKALLPNGNAGVLHTGNAKREPARAHSLCRSPHGAPPPEGDLSDVSSAALKTSTSSS